MKCLQGLHLYKSDSQKESRCFHSGLQSPPRYKAGRIATAVGSRFWGSTKPMHWLDDTLKAGNFRRCLQRRNPRPTQTANVCGFDVPGRDP